VEDVDGGCGKRNICVLSDSNVVIRALDNYAINLFETVASFPHEIGRM
jgi:hypothetical protein